MKAKCEKLDNFGRGIAYVNDKITFIPNFLPSEEAEIEIIKNKKNYAEGEIKQIITTSKERIKPKCPYNNCGCALKCLKYEKQLEYKQKKVSDILKKYGQIKPKINPIISSENIYGYRNKVSLKVKNKVGYHKNGTNEIIEISKCYLASDKINKIISILNKEDLSLVKNITIKDFDDLMVIIDGKMNINNLKQEANTIFLNNKLVYGKSLTTTKINNLTFSLSKESFFQVNKFITTKLYNKVLEYAGNNREQKVLDLYCGTGTITLLLSQKFNKVIGIEINSEAIKCANENKKANNINNVTFINGDVSQNIKQIKADIIVVDPPRNGLSKTAINDILQINPEKIIYVSCDIITLARDLNILKDKYNVTEITPFDMFPNTYHVECASILHRKNLEK